ncbi:hypothetical protein QQ045_031828 [Rhodiola kirilowii]
MSGRWVIASLLSLSAIAVVAFGVTDKEADLITALPGQPAVKFKQYSGYVTVDEKHGRALFYWLTEAVESPETKPLVLWLNGGPGCSSVAYGASEEIGPFRINKTGSSLYLNKYSWNRVANILFLESPAGVGYSYTNTSSDLKTPGDKQTAADALNFLINWFLRFPEYKNRDFYLSGESYAGHYVPQLAKRIFDYNKAASHPFCNFKGFIVGNAVTDNEYDSIGTVSYWWTHSIISDKSYRNILKSCNFSSVTSSKACDDAVDYTNKYEFGNIDQYSIYALSCTTPAPDVKTTRFRNSLLRNRPAGYDPCTENYAEIYYNRPDVQKALHANVTKIPYRWTACSDVVSHNWQDSDFTVIPIYKELMAAGLRIWMFSGDVDSVVPVTATRFSISHMNLKTKTPWYPWYTSGQVGGWIEVYNNLTFVTVRGAGHEVALLQPRRGFIMFMSFLDGKEMPRS